MKGIYKYCWIIILLGVISCKSKKDASADTESDPADVKTPVTLTSVSYEPMEEDIELKATSAYLQKTIVKATTTGYIKAANVKFGGMVSSGSTLFIIKTKEAESIGNTINKLDPSFKFSGVNQIRATTSGYVTELTHKTGDYVQDGEQLAVISDIKSFVFLLDLPYEYHSLIMSQKNLQLTLPDGTRLSGNIQPGMPVADSATQTQTIMIKVNTSMSIPPNIVASVKIIKRQNTSATTLPKAAILSNETQSEFWVMKLMNDSTAVKVPVKKGIETSDKIEIASPVFTAADKILASGNYGLSDTSKVIVTH